MPLYSCCYRSSYELPRRCVSAFSHSHVTFLQDLWASLSCWPPDMSIPQDRCPWLPQAMSVLTRQADTEHGPWSGAWVPTRSGRWHGSWCCFGPGQLVLAWAQLGVSTGQRSVPVDRLRLFWRLRRYSYVGMVLPGYSGKGKMPWPCLVYQEEHSLGLGLKEQSGSWRKKR